MHARIDRVFTALIASDGRLTEKEAASIACLSESRFRCVFRKQVGESFQRVRQCIRMDCARTRLTQTPEPIEEIAEALGYGSRSELERAFFRWFGIRPARHRKTITSAIFTAPEIPYSAAADRRSRQEASL